MIAVTVKNRNAVATPISPVTTGAVGIPVKFQFTDDWSDLAKTAVFRGSDTARDVLLGEDNTAIVPWEVLADPYGLLEIGIFGTDGEAKVTPTIWAKVGRIEPGTELSESDPADPTPSWAEQVMEAASKYAAVGDPITNAQIDALFT